LPDVVVHRGSQPDRDEVWGLNGSGIHGDTRLDAGDWHQPPPAEAMVVPRGDRLLLDAIVAEGEPPVCLGSVAVDAAPFSPLALAPEPASLVRLASTGTNDADLAVFPFEAPLEPGEWIVRVTLIFDTDPGPSRQESFFRMRVDVPPPTVDGEASAPVACTRPGDHPPRIFVSVDAGPWVRAEGGSLTWRGTSADGPAPIGPLVEGATGARLRVRIGSNVCAAWWRIELAPRPTVEWRNQEPFADLVPDRLLDYYTGPPGKANRFDLAAIPPGDWVVHANLWFANGRGELIGQTTNFWNVVVR
jgi:hypothetical protein